MSNWRMYKVVVRILNLADDPTSFGQEFCEKSQNVTTPEKSREILSIF